MSAPSSRAAEVLDRLAREQHRRPLYRRDPSDEPDEPAGSDAFGPGRFGANPPFGRRVIVGALVALGVATLALAFLVDRRAPAVEERLPLASEEPAPGDAGSAGGTAPRSDGAPGGADGPAAEGATEASEKGEAGDAVFVHIGGAVTSPGVVELPAGSRVVDAVRAAGGLLPDADPDRVNLAAQLVDGQRIVVPRVGQPVPAEVLPTGPRGAAGPSGDVAGDSAGGAGGTALVDLNAATAEQLEDLPGVGPATAAAILDHRERDGPFRSVDGLIDVRGIGEAKLEALRDLVTVGAG